MSKFMNGRGKTEVSRNTERHKSFKVRGERGKQKCRKTQARRNKEKINQYRSRQAKQTNGGENLLSNVSTAL